MHGRPPGSRHFILFCNFLCFLMFCLGSLFVLYFQIIFHLSSCFSYWNLNKYLNIRFISICIERTANASHINFNFLTYVEKPVGIEVYGSIQQFKDIRESSMVNMGRVIAVMASLHFFPRLKNNLNWKKNCNACMRYTLCGKS